MNTKLKTILIAGTTAGILDISAAVIIYPLIAKTTGKNILQYVASSVLGKESFQQGWPSALVGLALHFMIAFIFTSIFVLCYHALRKLISNKWLLGILYGCFVWLAMNLLVVPHSLIAKYPKPDFSFTKIPLSVLIIIVCVGLPISLITARIMKR